MSFLRFRLSLHRTSHQFFLSPDHHMSSASMFNLWGRFSPSLASSPLSYILPSARPSSRLTERVTFGTTSLSVTQTHCFYPHEDSLPFQSCLLGFQRFCNSRPIMEHSEVCLCMLPKPAGLPEAEIPIIKAIYLAAGATSTNG